MIFKGSSLLGLLLSACCWSTADAAQDGPPPVRDPAQLTSMSIPGSFTFAAVGDILSSKPTALASQNKPLADILQPADVAMGNLEITIIDLSAGKIHPTSNGIFLTNAEPPLATYLGGLGFDMVARANNHSMNWNVEGARETSRRLTDAGIVSAGYGETRSNARAAGFFDTPKGRVGLVSFTSTYFPGNSAADPMGQIPGTPGLSTLRTTRVFGVTPDQFQVLRTINDQHNPGATFSPPPAGPDELLLGPPYSGLWFKQTTKPDILYRMNPIDENEILTNVRTGKERSDFLVATMHFHEEPNCENWTRSGSGSAWRCGKPPEFVEKIAHEAIDNGADAFFAHGPHVMLGIEIYKGKPIFYSLGNFSADMESASLMRDMPPPGMDPKKQTEPEYFEGTWLYYQQDETMHEGVIAVTRFQDNRLAEIRLYPLDLGYNRRQARRGAPALAGPAIAQTVLKRMQSRSASYGTKIAIEGSVGVIRMNAQPTH